MIGCTKTQRGVKYAAILKGKRVFSLIGSQEMIQKHPIDLIDFLQSRLEFFNQVHFDAVVVNPLVPVGQPEVLGRPINCENPYEYTFKINIIELN